MLCLYAITIYNTEVIITHTHTHTQTHTRVLKSVRIHDDLKIRMFICNVVYSLIS